MSIVKHLDKLGIGGAVFAALCCLGISAVVTIVAAIGLGFLLNDAVLLPIAVVSLVVMLGGLALGFRRHRKPWALVIGTTGAAALLVSVFVARAKVPTYVSVAVLILASVVNVLSARPRPRRPEALAGT